MIENEYKVLLSKNEYERICNDIVWDYEYSQVNHYYMDDNRELKKKNITFRIREKGGAYKIQVKAPIVFQDALHVNNEYEEKIDHIPKVLSVEGMEEIVGNKIKEIKYIGNLKTLRKEKHYTKDILICLDKNEYLDTIDYEVEIEFSENVLQTQINNVLQLLRISIGEKAVGKNMRFITMLDKKEKD